VVMSPSSLFITSISLSEPLFIFTYLCLLHRLVILLLGFYGYFYHSYLSLRHPCLDSKLNPTELHTHSS
jgi:hypothetical protein